MPHSDPWLTRMLARKPRMLVAVALANPTARIARALMTKERILPRAVTDRLRKREPWGDVGNASMSEQGKDKRSMSTALPHGRPLQQSTRRDRRRSAGDPPHAPQNLPAGAPQPSDSASR